MISVPTMAVFTVRSSTASTARINVQLNYSVGMLKLRKATNTTAEASCQFRLLKVIHMAKITIFMCYVIAMMSTYDCWCATASPPLLQQIVPCSNPQSAGPLQALVAAAAAAGPGSIVQIPCGFHAVGPMPLELYGGVILSASSCLPGPNAQSSPTQQANKVSAADTDIGLSPLKEQHKADVDARNSTSASKYRSVDSGGFDSRAIRAGVVAQESGRQLPDASRADRPAVATAMAHFGGGLVFGACTAAQMHILHITGDNVTVSGIRFDASNLTSDANRDMACIKSEGGVPQRNLIVEGNRFEAINTTSQGYHALSLSGCRSCIIRDNYVPSSGGDALNFNSGEYTITGNVVENTGDGCIALNNNAVGIVSHNTLRRCNLGIGAGPSGTASQPNISEPFVITSNLMEDCDYGVLLGWFGYTDRLGPVGVVISNNIIRRVRSTAIGANAAPGRLGGALIISNNHVYRAGFPASPPPHTPPSKAGPGTGIVVAGLRTVSILGNVLSHGRGDAITVNGAADASIQANVVTTDAATWGQSAIGVVVSGGAMGVSVGHNTIAGFVKGIAVSGGADRVRVAMNSIEGAVIAAVAAAAVTTATATIPEATYSRDDDVVVTTHGGRHNRTSGGLVHAGVGTGRGSSDGATSVLSVDASVGRVFVVDNTVTGPDGTPASDGCVSVTGPINASRVVRGNTCW